MGVKKLSNAAVFESHHYRFGAPIVTRLEERGHRDFLAAAAPALTRWKYPLPRLVHVRLSFLLILDPFSQQCVLGVYP